MCSHQLIFSCCFSSVTCFNNPFLALDDVYQLDHCNEINLHSSISILYSNSYTALWLCASHAVDWLALRFLMAMSLSVFSCDGWCCCDSCCFSFMLQWPTFLSSTFIVSLTQTPQCFTQSINVVKVFNFTRLLCSNCPTEPKRNTGTNNTLGLSCSASNNNPQHDNTHHTPHSRS